MKTIKLFGILFLGLTVATSCSDDDDNPTIVNEEEVITTLRLTLTPDGGGTPILFQSQDLDGDGSNAPVVTVSGSLQAQTTYTGLVQVLNEQENPAEDITIEVLEEADEHQFFYTLSASSGLTITYADADVDGNPIGQQIELTTADLENGTLTVTLIHLPNKSASGVSNGDIANAGGETDAEVTFSYTVN